MEQSPHILITLNLDKVSRDQIIRVDTLQDSDTQASIDIIGRRLVNVDYHSISARSVC